MGRKATHSVETVREALALLKNPEFYADCQTIFLVRTTNGPLQPMVENFIKRWDVVPPRNFALLDPTTPRNEAGAILSGEWGLIPVFPWTTDTDVRRAAGRIRKDLGKRHKDARGVERGRLADWLSLCGFSAADIVREVFGRKARKVSFRQEQRLVRGLKQQGVSYAEIDARVSKQIRSRAHSAEKVAAMAVKRFRDFDRRLKTGLKDPIKVEPIAHALTILLKSIFTHRDAQVAAQSLETLRRHLLGLPSEEQKPA